MKLLFITQKVDKEDGVHGFVHGWLENLSQRVDELYAICLWQGVANLPQNVRVYSLGKERGLSKIGQLFLLQKHLLQCLKEVDGVFVHMSPIYAIFSSPLVKLFRKKMILWYAHSSLNLGLRIAGVLVDKIMTSIPEGCRLKKEKLVTGQGIDIEKFKPFPVERDYSHLNILFLARISPIKKQDIIIDVFSKLKQEISLPLHLNLVGRPTEKIEEEYEQKILKQIKDLRLENDITFWGEIANYKTPEIYNQNDIFIGLTPTGGFDKASLEAMACGLLTLSSSQSLLHFFSPKLKELLLLKENDAEDLFNKLKKVINLPSEEKRQIKKELREIIVEHHNLNNLTARIVDAFKPS